VLADGAGVALVQHAHLVHAPVADWTMVTLGYAQEGALGATEDALHLHGLLWLFISTLLLSSKTIKKRDQNILIMN
jgi:hypothetical protein